MTSALISRLCRSAVPLALGLGLTAGAFPAAAAAAAPSPVPLALDCSKVAPESSMRAAIQKSWESAIQDGSVKPGAVIGDLAWARKVVMFDSGDLPLPKEGSSGAREGALQVLAMARSGNTILARALHDTWVSDNAYTGSGFAQRISNFLVAAVTPVPHDNESADTKEAHGHGHGPSKRLAPGASLRDTVNRAQTALNTIPSMIPVPAVRYHVVANAFGQVPAINATASVICGSRFDAATVQRISKAAQQARAPWLKSGTQ
jgi:hypothetical protein